MKSNRSAIALLITMFFIIAITVAIGVGLKQVNKASEYVESEKLILQTNMLFDDVLTILNTSKELDFIRDMNMTGDDLEGFFSSLSIPGIPLAESGVIISLDLKSARSKFNVNNFKDNNDSQEALRYYLSNYMVESDYLNILLDVSGGISPDWTYLSGIFYEKSNLYRDYIVSLEHLEEINDFYTKRYIDNTLSSINFEKLFYFSKPSTNYKIDLNCVTVDTLEVLLADKNRAMQLVPNKDVGCSSFICDSLYDYERERLKTLGAECKVQKYIDVTVEVMQNDQNAKIGFEYDMNTKRGYNFVYEI